MTLMCEGGCVGALRVKENDKSESGKIDRALPVKRKEVKTKQSADAKGSKLSEAVNVDDDDDAWEMPDAWQAAVIYVEDIVRLTRC